MKLPLRDTNRKKESVRAVDEEGLQGIKKAECSGGGTRNTKTCFMYLVHNGMHVG